MSSSRLQSFCLGSSPESAFSLSRLRSLCFILFLNSVTALSRSNYLCLTNTSFLENSMFTADHVPLTNEPGHDKMCFMSYANNKGADQPVHPLLFAA